MKDSTKLTLGIIGGIILIFLYIMCIIWVKDIEHGLFAFFCGNIIGVSLTLTSK